MTSSQPRLTRAAIVDAAIDIADADGFAAVTMRAIADRLGVGAMSLYRHVADKDALLTAMTEAVGARFPYPHEMPGAPVPTDHRDAAAVVGHRHWRECVRIATDIDWTLYQRHPWVVLAYSSPRHSMGAASLGCLDWMMAAFAQLDVTPVRAAEMTVTLWSFVQGVALTSVAGELLRSTADAALDGDLVAVLDARETTAAELAAFPRVATLRGLGHDNGITDLRRRLDDGVELLCDGFEARAGR
ncbi:TetR/AcrR family transcriptional regulator [Williamsia sp. CHRR-6]|uniref:TetR/AcrR family transcriptional regulator n=1 Tax=Williamsia sp. CHRR-6 TaxID=2835871 RepID=UPI001BDA77B9|nr:TetR/AcrR family transcriptional regulator [Williamsia sp. CHRR-6]MBT0567207.1 TetR/AcrR family transcriptional regulator [Williamsia sp. CHRR-6]